MVLFREVLRHAATDLGQGTAHDPTKVPLQQHDTSAMSSCYR